MKKYFSVYKIELLNFLEYRSEFIAELVSIFVTLFITLFFALAVYERNKYLYGYTLSAFATYSLFSNIIGKIIDTDVNWIMSEDIKRGSLANFLVRPIRYNLYRLTAELSWKTHALFYNILLLAALTIVYAHVFTLQIVPSRIPLFLVSVLFSYILFRSFKYILGILAFWLKDSNGLSNFANNIIGLLGGSWLPLDFLGVFGPVLKLLPFSYIYYVPIQILMNQQMTREDIAFPLILELVWIILLNGISAVLWKKGVKIFESVGT